ncbi:MAG: PRC-barrel domain-containing protein [Burkholderiaceae bacterium]|nr:PRC-barrel domain-containing protein [Burkholderiaceae bacterium]
MLEKKLSALMRLVVVPTLAIGMAGPALAGGTSAHSASNTAATDNAGNSGTASTAGRSATASVEQDFRDLRASQVIHMSVRNVAGQNIGQISDMIVDVDSGKVPYAILRFDPGIFEGEELFAVPTTALRMAADRNDMVLDAPKERLRDAAIDADQWKDGLPDADVLAGLDRLWNSATPVVRASAHRMSDLIGMDVNSRSGEEIGELEDLVVRMNDQRVHYAVMEFDPSWAASDEYYALPLTAFRLTTDNDELVLDVDRSKVQAMKRFPEDRWANLNDPVWIADIDRYFVAVFPDITATGAQARAKSGDASASSAQESGS